MQAPIINKCVTPDRIAIVARFPSGSTFLFSITRNGHSVGYSDARNPKDSADRKLTLTSFVEAIPGETNAQRMGRVEAFLRGVRSTTELVKAIKGSRVKI